MNSTPISDDLARLVTEDGRPQSVAKVRDMFDSISKRYDLANSILSLGMHRLWERRLVSELPLVSSGRCLDLCTGTGALVPLLAKRYLSVIGVDISPGMLSIARRKLSYLPNALWVEGDAQELSFSDSEFDVVSVAYGVRNWPDYRRGLREVYRVLVKGGCVGILEFGQPRNPGWRWIFNLYARYLMPLIGGLISGERAPYEYLPATSSLFPCGGAFAGILEQAGFKVERVIPLLGGVAYIYLARKKDEG